MVRTKGSYIPTDQSAGGTNFLKSLTCIGGLEFAYFPYLR